MIEHRPVSELGGGDFGWLKALHHFHIGNHGNPAHKALGNLYVWNDDELAPGTGFHRIRTATSRSSPMSGRAMSCIATTWATKAGPRPVTCR